MKKHNKFLAILLALVLALGFSFAPQALLLAEEATPAQPFESFFSSLYNQKNIEQSQALLSQPFGFDTQVKFQPGEGLVMGASELELLQKFQYNFKLMTNPGLDDAAQLALDFSLTNPEAPDSSLNVSMYTVGEKAVIDLPGILDKPILANADFMSDFGSSITGEELPSEGFGEIASMPLTAIQAWENFMASFEEQSSEVRTLSIKEFSEDLNADLKFMPAEKLYPALEQLLQALKTEEDMEAYDEDFGDYSSFDLNEELSEMIEDLKDGDQNTDAYLAVLTDDNAVQRGYQLSFEDKTNNEVLHIDAYYLVDADNQVAPFIVSLSKENADGFVPMLQLNGQASGNQEQGFNADFVLTVVSEEDGEISTPLEGQIRNMITNNAENILEQEMSFELDLTLRGYDTQMVYIDPETGEKVDPFGMEDSDVEVTEDLTEEGDDEETPDDDWDLDDNQFETIDLDTYDIDFEKIETLVNLNIVAKQEGTRATADITIIPDANMPSQSITLNTVTDLLLADQVNIPGNLPEAFYDLDNPDDADALSENEEFQMKLFSILDELGFLD